MKKYLLVSLICIAGIFSSCSNTNNNADAYGNFEATEILISAESNGIIKELNIEEGSLVQANTILGYIDTTQLYLKKDQIDASINAVKSKIRDINTQIDVFNQQKTNLLRDKARIEKMYKDSAATKKQLDDIIGQIELVDKNLIASKTALQQANNAILSEISPLSSQKKQIDDNVAKSIIKSPISGTILNKYLESGEIVSFGKPIFKIADLNKMILKAYISGNQLSSVKIGQNVKVFIDNKDASKEYTGKVTWISGKAEFTPKIIQTKEERVNLVYAIKVEVKNDGAIKIGMPGEIKF